MTQGDIAVHPGRQRLRRLGVRAPSARSIAAVIIVLGLVFQLAQYATNRSLWLDEATLAQSILNRPVIHLRSLDYDQRAPIGFLLLEKLSVFVLGGSDYVLRLIPILAGCLALVLMARFAARYTTHAGMLLALALFATSDRMIFYASDVKPYSMDVFVCLGLYEMAFPLFADRLPRGRFVGFAIVGAMAPWFSYPAVFVLAAIGVGLLARAIQHADGVRRRWTASAISVWLLSFAALYAVFLRSVSQDGGLLDYWQKGFMPMPPWSDPQWLAEHFTAMFRDPVGLSVPTLGAIAFAVGGVSLFLRQWIWGLILVLPLPFVLLASGFQRYPFSGRLLLFIIPPVMLLIAEGVERMRAMLRQAPWLGGSVAVMLSAVLLATPTTAAIRHIAEPRLVEELRPLVSYLATQRHPGDLVYVYYSAVPAFKRYAASYSPLDREYIAGGSRYGTPWKYRDDLEKLRGGARVWFVFSHICEGSAGNEETLFLDHLDHIGRRLDEARAKGASLFLYDLR